MADVIEVRGTTFSYLHPNASSGDLPRKRLDSVAVCREVWSAISLSTDRKAWVSFMLAGGPPS
jgi:hypothetical protein